MPNVELSVQELYYIRRAVDVYTYHLREYIKEKGDSAIEPTVFDGILDKVESVINAEKEKINPSPSNP